jgi:ATP-dependent Lon protease
MVEEISTVEAQKQLALLPLKNVVILPKSILPVIVGRASSIEAVEYALRHDKQIFVTAQKNPDIQSPGESDVFAYGTRSVILQVMRMQNNSLKILVEGICRAKMTKSEISDNFMLVDCEDVNTKNLQNSTEIEALWRQIKSLYTTYARLNERAPNDLITPTRTVEDIEYLTDTIAVHLNLSFDERQQILEQQDFKKRLHQVAQLIQKEIDILETEQRIKGHIQSQVEKNQREYYLNEQIKAIHKELGRDDQQSEINALRQKLKTLGMPAEAHEKAERELRKLEQMSGYSSEASVSRNYIEWLTSIPWKKSSKDTLSMSQAEKILSKSHASLSKAKERILEFIAAKKFSNNLEKSPVICLVGPPGVGKTSLASSVAKSLGREFIRISLGGVRDEAEVRGHRRTYIGAMPGKLIQSMRKAKTVNPVILLDEIDKMSRDVHGDPAAALLEVLDPEQNKNFVDHYLDVDYDLSKVMFIATANTLDGIPYPLIDRMELITLSGYTEPEKLDITKKFLIPKNLKEHGLSASQIKVNDDILEELITSYTKEAGVRQIERVIAKIMRKCIQQMLLHPEKKSITVTKSLIKEWLGFPKFKKTSLDSKKNSIGIATGLAWTEVGGDVLEVETSVIPGKGSFTLTGQLGEVMQESAQAAYSYIRSNSKIFGLTQKIFSSNDLHIHVPEGATPKDGPSAGITMCTSMVSALTKTPTNPFVAMTGEITLRGRVLAVGGLKEKILAAERYGFTKVLVPKDNEDDITEILKEISFKLSIIPVSTMDEVIPHAFDKKPVFKSTSPKKTK